MKKHVYLSFIGLFFALSFSGKMVASEGISVYKQKINDPEAVYFSSKNNVDISDTLQSIINKLKAEKNFGIIFIPEGTYRISKTIYIPRAIRLIGYGEKRPEIVLTKNSPGFQHENPKDKGKANYMFWFVNNLVKPGEQPGDAGASTFYSAISNLNLKIEDGNPYAVALRTHFAQHSFISHVDIRIGNGKAGLYDVGNEMENVRFFGGDYGIYTTKSSPGWQVMVTDTYFEGQRKAAIRTQEAGLTMVRLRAKNVPVVIDIEPNYMEKLFMEDCSFENVSETAIIISNENNAANQISLRNITCKNVPVPVYYRRSENQTKGAGKLYLIKNFRHGLHIENMAADPEMKTICEMIPLEKQPIPYKKDIPDLPDVSSWVNIKDLGATGDGETDDTQIFREAIANHTRIYVPQGWYIISESLVLKENTDLIGLHPIATQLILKESTPAFSGFGPPKALLETPPGGVNIVTGIGLNTGGYNYRAVGCKWMAGAASYMNDVKFVGGHGNMSRGPEAPWRGGRRNISSPSEPAAAQGLDYAWDNQYWSLWITNGGGGTFKNIWTASSYAANGLYVNNTSSEGRIYAMSLEHHVRNEARFKNVSNWKVYAFQLEEESREGAFCQPVELENCSNMTFANLYAYQVIRVNTVYPYAVRTWNCRDVEFLNVHNYAQTKYTTGLTMYDMNTGIQVRPWEINYLYITGNEPRMQSSETGRGKPERLASGFEFAQGMSSDSKGNIYFCEQRLRRVYKFSVETNTLSLVADFPWEPLSTACDTQDNLLVIFKYNPQPGYLIDGKQETVPDLPDSRGTSFSGWGNSGFGVWVYAVNPDNPEESIRLLPQQPMDSITSIRKAFYPSNRWRDYHDFNEAAPFKPQYCFVAPDGVTIIPCQYDLARSCAVLEAVPGKPFYTSDEYDKRMVKMDVDERGVLSNLKYFTETGEFGSAVDADGNLYVADGQIYVFDKEGKKTREIKMPERPLTMAFGGKDKNTLFVHSYKSLYRIKLSTAKGNDSSDRGKIVLAYVTSWSNVIPDPDYLTHINYAFGHVNKTFNGIRIDNEERLRMIVGLKEEKPSLKIMLSVGGWGSGNFSEMAADESNRRAFAADCKRVIDKFGLDGIDIDWEYPTDNAAKISSSPEDTKNFTLMMQEIRTAVGKDKLLTLASSCSAQYIDFKAINSVIDFVNIMTYDMGRPPKHHSGLYRSSMTGYMSAEESVNAHVEAGIPLNKLTLGIPFYGRGNAGVPNFIGYGKIIQLTGYTDNWDETAKVPYLTNAEGVNVCSYENAKSISIKCQYLLKSGMLGAMYWDYAGDDDNGTLRKTVYREIMTK